MGEDRNGNKMISSGQIQQATETLRHAAPNATIILFGSHARGNAGWDSDVDFLIIETELKERRREMARLARTLRPLRIRADVLVFSRRTYDEWSRIPGTVIHAVAREGKVLHAGE